MNTLIQLLASYPFRGDLFHLLIEVVAFVVAIALLWWLIQFIREPFLVQLCRIVLVVFVAITLIYFLLSL